MKSRIDISDGYILLIMFAVAIVVPILFHTMVGQDLLVIALLHAFLSILLYLFLCCVFPVRPGYAFRNSLSHGLPIISSNFTKTLFSVLFLYISLSFIFNDQRFIEVSKTQQWKDSVGADLADGRGILGIIELIVNITYFLIFRSIFLTKSKLFINFWFIGLAIMVADAFLYGLYRSPVVFLGLGGLYLYHVSVRRVRNFKSMVIVSAPFTLLYLSWMGLRRDGVEGAVSMVRGLSGLNTFSETFNIIEAVENRYLNFELGLQYLYSLISFVPRFIWPDKPVVSFNDRITQRLYGELGEDTWVHTFTIWGEGYLQFGWFGFYFSVVLLFLFTRVVCYLCSHIPSIFPGFLFSFYVSMPLLIRGDLFSVFASFWKVFFGASAFFFFVALISFSVNKPLRRRML